MANTLSKIGITTGNTVTAGHVTQSIDAFTGTEAYDITLSGSFTMSGGEITGVAGVENSLTASYATTASYIATASYALNANTASYALNATPTFPYTGSAIISGSLSTEGPTSLTGSLNISSTLSANADTIYRITSVDASSNPTIPENENIVVFSGAGTIVLPPKVRGKKLTFIDAEGGNVVKLEGSGSDNVNGVSLYTITPNTQYQQTTVISDGTQWYASI